MGEFFDFLLKNKLPKKNKLINFSLYYPLSDDELVKRSQYLLEKLNYPWEMMPLMYVILKGADGDVQTAHRRIDEGMAECSELGTLISQIQPPPFRTDAGCCWID